MTFRPKSKARSSVDKTFDDTVWDNFKNSKSGLLYFRKNNIYITYLSFFSGLVLVFYLISTLLYSNNQFSYSDPPPHGYYKHEILSSSPLIFPDVNHAVILKDLGVKSLYSLSVDSHGVKTYVYKPDEIPLNEKDKKDISDPLVLVKTSFSDHGKLVYKRSKEQPELVIVTLIDFENYKPEFLTQIVQNRINYSKNHNYGLYIRWAQEFIPAMEKLSLQDNFEFAKPLIMRAAMHAFPMTKYFWFIDQNALIKRMEIPFHRHVLNDDTLDSYILRSVPVFKDSNIRTYKHSQAKNADIIMQHTNSGDIDTTSFIITLSLHGQAFLDYFNDPMIRNYGWSQQLASGISHMLQWHPKILARTALVRSNTISTIYNPTKKTDESLDIDNSEHTAESFIISFEGCRQRRSCDNDVAEFYKNL